MKTLIIDNYDSFTYNLAHMLLRAGCRVDVVRNDEVSAREVAALRPDVASLDVRLPDGSGIEVCREIRSLYPSIACLMLTSYADDEALFAAIMAGAAGYVLKEIGGSDLIGDIRRVSQGASLIDANLSKDIFDRLRKSQKTEARLSSLSPQERKVLDLIAQEAIVERWAPDRKAEPAAFTAFVDPNGFQMEPPSNDHLVRPLEENYVRRHVWLRNHSSILSSRPSQVPLSSTRSIACER